MPSRSPVRIALWLSASAGPATALLALSTYALAAPHCRDGRASEAAVGRPAAACARRAGIVARTPLWSAVPGRGTEQARRVNEVWPWKPRDFLRSYILPTTAHSNVR